MSYEKEEREWSASLAIVADSMPAHMFCGLLKGGLGSCMAIGRNLALISWMLLAFRP